MKILFIIGILLFITPDLFSQNIKFPPSIVSAAGGSSSNSNPKISKWRIGRVNVIQLGSTKAKSANIYLSDQLDKTLDKNWEIFAYPNPVQDFLQIEFDINLSKPFAIEVNDVSGRKVLERKVQLILPGEIVQLDLQKLKPSIYIINVWSNDHSIFKILKVSKQ